MANVYVYRACSGCVDTVEMGRERERDSGWGAWVVERGRWTNQAKP